MPFNPYAREIKFAQAVNKAIIHHISFQIYRTFEGKVQKCEIRMLDVNVMTGEISIDFKLGEEIKFEKASKQDLVLISQQARQLEAAASKFKRKHEGETNNDRPNKQHQPDPGIHQ